MHVFPEQPLWAEDRTGLISMCHTIREELMMATELTVQVSFLWLGN